MIRVVPVLCPECNALVSAQVISSRILAHSSKDEIICSGSFTEIELVEPKGQGEH